MKANQVENLHAAWMALNERQHALLEQSATAGTSVLDAQLEGDPTEAIKNERARAAELVALESAIKQARPRRIAAIKAQREVEAAEIRAEAEPLRRQAQEIRSKRDELLGQLFELQGVEHAVRCQRDGVATWTPVGRTNSEKLDDQAAGIELQADRHASQPVTDSNYVEAATLDELLDQVRALPLDELAPSFGDVREAFEQCVADHQRVVVGGQYFVTGRNAIALRWAGDQIQAEALPGREHSAVA